MNWLFLLILISVSELVNDSKWKVSRLKKADVKGYMFPLL